MNTLTQQLVDEWFAEHKTKWDAAFKASEQTQPAMFIALDATGFAGQAVYDHSEAKRAATAQGFTMPELVPGLSITECAPVED